uniref:3-oxoacyl-[acyl-carrier-protein] reductase n=1 Tax=Coccolithus braarudii TaxID=221442 RepID=A0A7S0LFW7_9EUKA|mmetsp:Transcript_35154/g.75049  ORF Transcript_35154/g.75049 Transcript_35154/m.75049 type:complete len:252 (+) Transcript_35154:30-785(+)
MQFGSQVALVTGGARGIGFAIAQELVSRGGRVCLVDLDEAALASASSELRRCVPGAQCMTVRGNVTDILFGEEAVAAVTKQWARIDVLVQAAGITGKTGIQTDEVDASDFDKVMAVNVRGIFVMCRAVLPVMRSQKYGRIVNIASISGKEGNAGMLAYSVSKAAVIGLTKVVGKELAETGITCNALAPAVVRTEMVAAMPEAQVKYMTDKIPMKRTGELHEIAHTVCFIASRECSFTTGFCFDATGGRATF